MKIILGSGSQTRRKIMDGLKLKYDVVVSDYDEDLEMDDPVEYVKELSRNKSKNIIEKINEDALVITADSIIYKDGKKYEKPQSIKEAMENMREFSGTVNQAITGVTLYDTKNNNSVTFACTTNVYLKEIKEEDIKWYVEHEEDLLHKAGYSLEGVMSLFVDKIDGDYYNVLGLPVSMIYSKVNELGYWLNDF